jgi:hypothetical protein
MRCLVASARSPRGWAMHICMLCKAAGCRARHGGLGRVVVVVPSLCVVECLLCAFAGYGRQKQISTTATQLVPSSALHFSAISRHVFLGKILQRISGQIVWHFDPRSVCLRRFCGEPKIDAQPPKQLELRSENQFRLRPLMRSP